MTKCHPRGLHNTSLAEPPPSTHLTGGRPQECFAPPGSRQCRPEFEPSTGSFKTIQKGWPLLVYIVFDIPYMLNKQLGHTLFLEFTYSPYNYMVHIYTIYSCFFGGKINNAGSIDDKQNQATVSWTNHPRKHMLSVVPQRAKSRSWCVYNSNFTIWFMVDILTYFLWL